MTKVVGIIPARYASTRFPGKPLIDIGGKTMIQRVYEQALKAENIAEVWVATDDERIEKNVIDFGGKVIMTSANHINGTSRIAEAVEKNNISCDAVINIQGDEPFIQPSQLNLIADALCQPNNQIVTLIKKISNIASLKNSATVKVVKTNTDLAMYFSRNAIPFNRDYPIEEWLNYQTYYKHIGIYGFQKSCLLDIVKLPLSPAEKVENLEQLRWLENGYNIKLIHTTEECQAIDTPEDLEKIILPNL